MIKKDKTIEADGRNETTEFIDEYIDSIVSIEFNECADTSCEKVSDDDERKRR